MVEEEHFTVGASSQLTHGGVNLPLEASTSITLGLVRSHKARPESFDHRGPGGRGGTPPRAPALLAFRPALGNRLVERGSGGLCEHKGTRTIVEFVGRRCRGDRLAPLCR